MVGAGSDDLLGVADLQERESCLRIMEAFPMRYLRSLWLAMWPIFALIAVYGSVLFVATVLGWGDA